MYVSRWVIDEVLVYAGGSPGKLMDVSCLSSKSSHLGSLMQGTASLLSDRGTAMSSLILLVRALEIRLICRCDVVSFSQVEALEILLTYCVG